MSMCFCVGVFSLVYCLCLMRGASHYLTKCDSHLNQTSKQDFVACADDNKESKTKYFCVKDHILIMMHPNPHLGYVSVTWDFQLCKQSLLLTLGFCGLCKFCVLMIFNAWETTVALRLKKCAKGWKCACSNIAEVLLHKEVNPKPLQCCFVVKTRAL